MVTLVDQLEALTLEHRVVVLVVLVVLLQLTGRVLIGHLELQTHLTQHVVVMEDKVAYWEHHIGLLVVVAVVSLVLEHVEVVLAAAEAAAAMGQMTQEQVVLDIIKVVMDS